MLGVGIQVVKGSVNAPLVQAIAYTFARYLVRCDQRCSAEPEHGGEVVVQDGSALDAWQFPHDGLNRFGAASLDWLQHFLDSFAVPVVVDAVRIGCVAGFVAGALVPFGPVVEVPVDALRRHAGLRSLSAFAANTRAFNAW